ncbi:MAG: hypothetical protein IT317_10375 [Anaerolineales bacterium]|nr:hypothetical protein [Anaerolineales bacterium]
MIRPSSERYLTNPDDVAANRSGTLTDGQRRKASQVNWGAGAVALLVGALIGGGLVVPFFIMFQEQNEPLALIIPALILLVVGVPVGLVILQNIVRLALTRQDLAAGEVQTADGQVAWRRRRYAAEWPGRPFWTNNSVSGLAPGPYRFYYLPRSGYVLSAEKLGGLTLAAGMMGGGETPGLTEVLGRVIGFGAGDLEANRDGRLGGGQAARMVAAAAGLGVLALVILGFCAFAAFNMTTENGGLSAIPLLFIGAIGLFGPLLVGWAALKIVLDLLGGRVQVIEGQVQRTYSSSGKSTTYYYQVGGKKFTVSLRAYHALVSGPTYRVYYTPRAERLVALEAKE